MRCEILRGDGENAESRCTQEVELPGQEESLARRDREGGVNVSGTIHRDGKQMGRNLRVMPRGTDWTVFSRSESAVLEDPWEETSG